MEEANACTYAYRHVKILNLLQIIDSIESLNTQAASICHTALKNMI